MKTVLKITREEILYLWEDVLQGNKSDCFGYKYKKWVGNLKFTFSDIRVGPAHHSDCAGHSRILV